MRHARRVLPWVLALLAVAFFATMVSGQQEAEPKKKKTDWEKISMTAPVVPDAEKQRENPYAWNAEARAKGKQYFTSQCTMCHGADGRGSGDLVERLNLARIPDFTDAEFQSGWTDGAMYYVIQQGHGAMPGQKNRFDPEIKWGMVNYVRSFSRAE